MTLPNPATDAQVSAPHACPPGMCEVDNPACAQRCRYFQAAQTLGQHQRGGTDQQASTAPNTDPCPNLGAQSSAAIYGTLADLALACVGVFTVVYSVQALLHAAGPGLFALLRRAFGT